jgi:hypothetical protein
VVTKVPRPAVHVGEQVAAPHPDRGKAARLSVVVVV